MRQDAPHDFCWKSYAETFTTGLVAQISVARRAASYGLQRDAPLWQKRYYDHNVRNYASFVEKLRYLHRNPGSPSRAAFARDGVEVR